MKPSNILLRPDGDAVLTDFGIAKVLGEVSQQLTYTSHVVGSAAYMSPEQGRGRPLDARSDIYSLGIVLYQMLTGDVPFKAESPTATIYQHIHEPPKPPRQINPRIPPSVERVVLKALAKSPEKRYQTADELAKALAEAVQSKKVKQRAGPRVIPLWAFGGGMLVLIIGILIVGSSILNRGGAPTPSPIMTTRAVVIAVTDTPTGTITETLSPTDTLTASATARKTDTSTLTAPPTKTVPTSTVETPSPPDTLTFTPTSTGTNTPTSTFTPTATPIKPPTDTPTFTSTPTGQWITRQIILEGELNALKQNSQFVWSAVAVECFANGEKLDQVFLNKVDGFYRLPAATTQIKLWIGDGLGGAQWWTRWDVQPADTKSSGITLTIREKGKTPPTETPR